MGTYSVIGYDFYSLTTKQLLKPYYNLHLYEMDNAI